MIPYPHLSNEKNLGCLGYIGDYTTQLCGDCNKPLQGFLLTIQYFMESTVGGFFSWLTWDILTPNLRFHRCISTPPLKTILKSHLGGGNSNILYFHPDPWGNDPIWRAYFSDGWLNHQLVTTWAKLESESENYITSPWIFVYKVIPTRAELGIHRLITNPGPKWPKS